MEAWNNFAAELWFIDFTHKRKFREKIVNALKKDINVHGEVIRAASYILICLGREYIWPSAKLDDDLRLAIDRMGKLLQRYKGDNNRDIRKEIEIEIEILKNRFEKNSDDLNSNLRLFSKIKELTLLKNRIDGLPDVFKSTIEGDWEFIFKKPGVKEFIESIVLGEKSQKTFKILHSKSEYKTENSNTFELLLIEPPFLIQIQEGTSKEEAIKFFKNIIFELENSC